MKILRVITRLNVGGPARQAVLLTHGLARRGHRTILVSGLVPENEGSMEYLLEGKNIEWIVIPTLQRELNFKKDYKSFRELVKIIRQEKPDIVHSHMAKAGMLARVAVFWVRIFHRG